MPNTSNTAFDLIFDTMYADIIAIPPTKKRCDIPYEARNIIQNERSENRYIEANRKTFKDINYFTKGGVFWHENSILKMYKARKRDKVCSNKTPFDSKRYIGIEIEFLSPYEDESIIDGIIKHKLEQWVTYREDGSVQGPEEEELYGHEVCVLVSEAEYKSVLLQITHFLDGYAASINSTCGLHVHLDMRNRNKEKCFNNLVAAQSLLYRMLPYSRKVNEFCGPVRGRKWHISVDRYRSFNTRAYRKHRTIEVRMHSGTTSYTKITNWIQLLLKIVNASKIEGNLPTIGALSKRIRLSKKLDTYMRERTAQFKSTHQNRIRMERE